ncbi:MAG: hypothetical protein RR857_14260 [Comamonas sp.]|uniref:helix-turn-helix transcriptional regulator n=2 Tax=Comamonas sp. TaxID=34028 RepID=UPI002FC5E4A1
MPRKNTSCADSPQAVLRDIERLAQNITIARKRRGESQTQWARKLGISQPNMGRIERGDPSVAMASYGMCMWLINQGGGLADLIARQNDHAALEKEVAKVHTPRKLDQQGRAGLPAAQWNSAPVESQQAAVAERPESAPPSPTGRRPPLAGAARRSDPIRQDTDAICEVRKSLASATRQSDQASSSTASGLAALLMPRLIQPDVTLGGARPKALLQTDKGQCVIKFSELDDAVDTPLIEHATQGRGVDAAGGGRRRSVGRALHRNGCMQRRHGPAGCQHRPRCTQAAETGVRLASWQATQARNASLSISVA